MARRTTIEVGLAAEQAQALHTMTSRRRTKQTLSRPLRKSVRCSKKLIKLTCLRSMRMV